MPTRLACRVLFPLLVGSFVACSHRQPPQVAPLPVCAGEIATDRSALTAAPALIAKAVAGVRVRGEQDEMLRLEAKLPGFGGWYIDSTGQVVAYMKPSAGTSPTLVRETIYQTYAARPEAVVRKIMAPAYHAKIVDGDYTLSELIAIENRIANPRVAIPGLTGFGTSLFLNRVKVGFTDTASVCAGVAAITSMGVPRAAIIPEVWGVMHLLSAPEERPAATRTRTARAP